MSTDTSTIMAVFLDLYRRQQNNNLAKVGVVCTQLNINSFQLIAILYYYNVLSLNVLH